MAEAHLLPRRVAAKVAAEVGPVTACGDGTPPYILFGACDRHNLGDLLFPHIFAALLAPRPVVVAGLAERDLTAFGGHRVRALARLAVEWGEQPAHLLHVGGELLTCSLYEAAVMTLPAAAARAAIARYDRDAAARQAWAEAQLGLPQQVAYLAPKSLFRRPGRFLHCALGGVDLPHLPAAMRAEVAARLNASDALTVRDHFTQAALADMGIDAGLTPDPAELIATLFGERIARHAAAGEPARLRARFAQGYAAVQFAAEFGDESTLQALAAELERIAAASGLALVLFRAGAAPWHDAREAYVCLRSRLRCKQVALFNSLNIWDICALLAGARLYLGSSLHARIIAAAHGVPAVSLCSPPAAGRIGKVAAYLATWHRHASSSVVPVEQVAAAAADALTQPAACRSSAMALREAMKLVQV